MGIFSRFTDIINSNINNLLDKAEDPKKMVRLIIQEMEDTLVEVRSSSAKTLADKKTLERQISHYQQASDEWQHKAEVALNKSREDLARAALLEKNKLSEYAETLVKELADIDENIAKLQSEVAQLQDKLADAKARQKAILLREKTVTSRLKVKSKTHSSKINQALERFEQYERKIDDLESQVESHDLGANTLANEIEELAANEQIDNELAALKAKMNKEK